MLVGYRTTGTATSGSDYTAPAGSVTVPAGQTSAVVTVDTATDAVLDPGETLALELTSVSGGGGAAAVGSPASALVTLVDPGSVTVDLSAAAERVTEGAAVTLGVALSGPVAKPVMLQWKTETGVSDTAVAGTDYTARSPTALTFASGATGPREISVPTRVDRLVEGDETFEVRLEGVTGTPLPDQVSLGTAASTVTIADDDVIEVSIAPPPTVIEGTDAVFRVFAVGGISTADVVVPYEVGGTTIAGTDYTTPSGSVTVGTGMSVAEVTIATLNDRVLDPSETLEVTLRDPVETAKGTARLGVPNVARVDVTEPAGAGVTVSVQAVGSPAVAEGSAASFKVVLSGTVASDVTVAWFDGGRHRDRRRRLHHADGHRGDGERGRHRVGAVHGGHQRGRAVGADRDVRGAHRGVQRLRRCPPTWR